MSLRERINVVRISQDLERLLAVSRKELFLIMNPGPSREW